MQSKLISDLIKSFSILPGVGPKTAQRMAYYLLERNRKGGTILANTILDAVNNIKNCDKCRDLTEQTTCDLCLNDRRDNDIICVVETPADVMAIEQSQVFSGKYFVLLGHLSPIDGIGPNEIGVDLFAKRLEQKPREVILATSTTVEGETTAYFLAEMTKKMNIKTTRIAHGVPLGGELENIDGGTLYRAMTMRQELAEV